MKIIPALLLLAAALSSGQSRPGRLPVFNHPLALGGGGERPVPRTAGAAAPETLRVLAVMVAFQEDADTRTTGTGDFDLSSPPTAYIDAPPHNKEYFQNHLLFLENYFRKSSDGKLTVTGTVLDSVYRLPHQMQYYSPQHSSATNTELGSLMEDAWHTVDSVSGSSVSFDSYQVFLIFHAGAGRDIDFVSIYGYDPTPFDLPSIFLNLAGLKKMFGDSYQGVALQHASRPIQNSLIIPETENRELEGVTGTSLLKLGINGLMAASMGSYLGLPDLFDTKAGSTGIGRFGLMDGQSIFSWNGIFPPEPSAWEKYFLGWVDPVTVASADTVLRLPAVSLGHGEPDTMYLVGISRREYFLVENRNRDANRDGAIVTMVSGGQTIVKQWQRDTTNFNANDQDSLVGVVTDVDEFDWSLPGGVNTETGEFFDGGILIWHIDEGVIDAGYSTDEVNANPSRRGVNLMEADGSQDIGQSYGFLSAGGGSENGTALDFWFAGNSAPLRRQSNEFSPTSHPSSASNDLANSHIRINGFSARAPVMSARFFVGDAQISPLPGFPKSTGLAFGTNSLKYSARIGNGTGLLVAATRDYGMGRATPQGIMVPLPGAASVYAWDIHGKAPDGFRSSGLVARAFAYPDERGDFTGTPVLGDDSRRTPFRIATPGNLPTNPGTQPTIWLWTLEPGADSLSGDTLRFLPTRELTTGLVSGDSLMAAGMAGGMVFIASQNGAVTDSLMLYPGDTSRIVGVSLLGHPDKFLATSAGGTVGVLTSRSQGGVLSSVNFSHPMSAPAVCAVFTPAGEKRIVFATTDGFVYAVDSTLNGGLRAWTAGGNASPGFPVATGGEILGAPAIADLGGTQQKDIIVFSGNKIYAINPAGAIVAHFPIVTPTQKTLLASPIVADLDARPGQEVVAVTQEGIVVAYDNEGRMAGGFPLLAGANSGSTPVAFQISDMLGATGIGLAVASDDGQVYAWRTGLYITPAPVPRMMWPQYMLDAQNTGLDETTPEPFTVVSDFLPAASVYPWPNPVGRQDGFLTHIRYFVTEDAKVTVKIFDMAGDMVADLSGQGSAGLDNEILWNVSGIQSGVYFARVEATGATKSAHAIVKIAVVK